MGFNGLGTEALDAAFGITSEVTAFVPPIEVAPISNGEPYAASEDITDFLPPILLQPEDTESYVTSREYRSRDFKNKKSARHSAGLALAAVGVVLAAGVSAHVASSSSITTGAQSNAPTVTGSSPSVHASESAPGLLGPNMQASASPKPTPTDYRPGFISFGTANNGCRELGTYSTPAATIAFKVRDHDHTLSIPKAQYDLYTCAENPQIIYNNKGVDSVANVVKKEALVNEGSFSYEAHGPTPKAVMDTMVIRSILPAQAMINKGYKNVCQAFKPALVGCNSVPVPSEYLLSAKEVAKYKYTAEIMLLMAVQSKCGPVEMNNEQLAIVRSLQAQAIKQGVDPLQLTSKDLRVSFVDTQLNAVKVTPDYTGSLESGFVKAGGISDPSQLFGKITVPALCIPDVIKAVA